MSKSYNLIKPIKAKKQDKLVEENKELDAEEDNKSENNMVTKRRKTQIIDTKKELGYSSIFSCIDWENDNDQDDKDSKNQDDDQFY